MTVIVAVIGDEVVLVAVKLPILPEPLVANPIAVLLLVHEYEPPAGVFKKFVAGTVVLLHTVIFAGTATDGDGLTVIECVCDIQQGQSLV